MGKNQNPIDAAIDKACGFTKEDMDVMAENVAVGKKVREIATVCEEFAKTLTTRQRVAFGHSFEIVGSWRLEYLPKHVLRSCL